MGDRGNTIADKVTALREELMAQTVLSRGELNPGIKNLRDKIRELQDQCPHEWDTEGVCIFCGLEDDRVYIE